MIARRGRARGALRAGVTALLWVAGARCAPARRADAVPAPTCAVLRERLAMAGERARAEPPLEGFRRLSRFLETVDDDAGDCVTSDARRRLAALETKLVALRTPGGTLFPDKVLHCNELAPPSLHCSGPELDDTPLVDEEQLVSRRARGVPASAAVTIAPGYDASVVGVYAGERGALQDGANPVALPIEDGAIELTAVRQMKGPVLILCLHRRDGLAYRKFVWFL